MTSNNTYPKSMMFFHLLGIILVLAAYVSVSMTELFSKWSVLNNTVLQTHFFVWLLVLVFVIPRFIVRLKKHKEIPPIVPALTKKNEILAHAWHIAIYVWMVVMPLLGWALASATYGSIDIYGIHIPGIVAKSKDTAKLLSELHEMCGWIGMFLISGHVIMALLHHFKMQDNTITRMFPWFKWRIKNNKS